MMPSGWKVVYIKEVGTVVTGSTPPTKDLENYGDEYMFVSPADMGSHKLIRSSVKRVSKKGFDKGRKIPPKSTLFTCIGSTIGKIGMNEVELITNQQINSVVPNSDVDPDFIYYSLENVAKRIKKMAGQQAVPLINKSDFEEETITLPSNKNEQEKIAKILSTWDEAIEKLEVIYKAKTELKSWYSKELFQDEDWNESIFEALVDKYIDYRGRTPLKIGMNWGGGTIPALSANNIQNGFIDFAKECHLGSDELYKKWMTNGDCQRGDVLMTMEAPLGNIAQIPDDKKYILSQRALLIRPKNEIIDSNFLAHLMRSDLFQNQLSKNASGSTAQGIQRKRLDKIPIMYPSLEEQNKISTLLTALDKELILTHEISNAIKLQKQGLMQQLLTGQKRVKV